MTEPLVQTVEICKRYRSGDRVICAVSDLSLLIQQGEFVALTGPSGSISELGVIIHLVDAGVSLLFSGAIAPRKTRFAARPVKG